MGAMLALRLAFRRNRRNWIGAALLLLGALVVMVPMPYARAAGTSAPALASPGAFDGTWVYRSFLASPDAGRMLAPQGFTILTLTEANGVLTGTRNGQKEGETFPVSGAADYQPNAITFTLEGLADAAGKSWNYRYFGYLVPTWPSAGVQADAIMGTMTRTDPADAKAPALVAFFTAVKQP